MNRDTETKTRAGVLGTFLGYIKERRETVGNNLHITASQVLARPLVNPVDMESAPGYNLPQGGQGPQQAPDPIRQSIFDGLGHISKARIPVWRSAYDQTAWENQSFIAGKTRFAPGAGIPFGNMTPGYERTNIYVPNAPAYGSQFTYQALPYGYE